MGYSIYNWSLSKNLERFEVAAAKRADCTHFISQYDRCVFEARGVGNTKYIPVLMPPIERVAPPHLREPLIVFLGNMGYLPNHDGVWWLVNEILPLVKRDQPRARLRIIGPGLSRREVEALARQGIECVGEVADIRNAIEDAAVAVAPVRLGTGVKVKVLELMWHGLPMVVTTPCWSS